MMKIRDQIRTVIFCFGLICSLVGLSAHAAGDDIIAKAKVLAAELNFNIHKDLDGLWAAFAPFCEASTEGEFYTRKQAWMERLRADQKAFLYLQNATGGRGSYPLRTSLRKLVGASGQTGLLLDALKLLEDAKACTALKPDWGTLDKDDKENARTVLKTTLIYANLALQSLSWSDVNKQLEIVYPERFPACVRLEKDAQLPSLCSAGPGNSAAIRILIPNSGYVFGGNFFGRRCRGIDCSAYASHCVGCSERISTSHMEAIWKLLRYDEQSDDPVVLKVRDEFEALDPAEGDSLEAGDLVVWRHASGGGHVAIFQEWVEDGEQPGAFFLAYDASRSDDKKREGIRQRRFVLHQAASQTYVLRRIGSV